MAIEFRNGRSILDNDAIPEWGKFVNPEKWEYMKSLKDRLIIDRLTNKKGIGLSIRSIEEIFSPIICPITRFVYRTSIDQFKIFCETEGIECIEDYKNQTFLLRIL